MAQLRGHAEGYGGMALRKASTQQAHLISPYHSCADLAPVLEVLSASGSMMIRMLEALSVLDPC